MQQGLLQQPTQTEEPSADQQAIDEAVRLTEQEMGGQQGQPQQPGMQPQEEEGEAEDPMLDAAIDFVKRALYETGSADSIHETMKASRNPVEDMAMLAYELTSVADEKTEGQVPDELLMTLAATVLTEVSEIAESSGVQLQPADIAQAFKMMTLRFVGEMGHDTRQLEQAFNEVSPEQINEIAAAEVGNV